MSRTRKLWAGVLAAGVTVALATVAVLASAEVPGTITYAGRLLDQGVPVNRTVSATFTLYPSSQGGTPLWSQTFPQLPVNQGDFEVTLGTDPGAPLDDLVLSQPQVWLESVINGVTLAPRSAVTSVPYAILAGTSARAESLSASPPGTEGTFLQSQGPGQPPAWAVPVPPGVVMPFAGTQVPQGWLPCDGSLVSREDYASLFAVVGATYGQGDGSTTFALPDLRARFPLGVGGPFAAPGRSGGQLEHVHTVSATVTGEATTAGNHTHTFTTGYPDAWGEEDESNAPDKQPMGDRHHHSGTTAGAGAHTHPLSASCTGTTTPADPPFLTLHYIIKT
jgi:microcystin-dependent protein